MRKFAPTLSLVSALLLSGCAIAPAMTAQEANIKQDVELSKFMPATREMRDNIETQPIFAQAAFWSHEYDLNPSDLESALKLAASVRKLGNPARAIEITQTSRAIHPRDPYLLAEHAAGLIAAERAIDAVPVLDSGLRLAPQYARLWSLKGAALDQLEEYGTARQHYARALSITPNDPNILANVGLSHALSGDPVTAEGWLRRAVAAPGASAGVRQNLALVLQLQGKTEEAERQNRLAGMSRGDQKLPRPPVPAHQMKGSTSFSGQPAAQGRAQAQAQRSHTNRRSSAGNSPMNAQAPQQSLAGVRPGMPGAQAAAAQGGTRLLTQSSNGQPFTSASDAARAAARARSAQSQASSGQPPAYRKGEMTRDQQNALSRIGQSVRPGSAVPHGAQPQPHVVGPALRGAPQAQQGYAPQGRPPQGYAQPAPAPAYGQPQQTDPRRGAARRRR